MIVIVIVGILSAVALPNFLNQTGKAKLSEAKANSSAYLKLYHTSSLESDDAATAATAAQTAGGDCPPDSTNFTYDCTTTPGTIVATPTAESGLDTTSDKMTSSVDGDGKVTIDS